MKKTENNVLIAEFMGRRGKVRKELFWINLPHTHWLTADMLVFHSDWNWLMPVCQKIDVILSDNVATIGYSDECLYSNDIEIRHQAVVEFINWYNKWKK